MLECLFLKFHVFIHIYLFLFTLSFSPSSLSLSFSFSLLIISLSLPLSVYFPFHVIGSIGEKNGNSILFTQLASGNLSNVVSQSFLFCLWSV